MDDCLFCKIIKGEIPSKKVYEDDAVFAFCDIDPQAPVHILIIPKAHVKSALQVEESMQSELMAMFLAAKKIAKEQALEENGFRLVLNTGKDGGQTVDHLHMHLLGGRQMTWPPG